MRSIRTGLAVLTAGLLLSAPGAAAKNYAPPGKAGTSEYAEDIPAAGGNVPTPSMDGGNKTAAQIDHLGAGKVGMRKLAKLGKTGAAAAQFAQQTAPVTTNSTTSPAAQPTTAAGTSHHHSTAAGRPASAVLTASGGSAISGLGHVIGGSDVDGIGVFLPLLLVLSAVGAVVVGVLRMRRPGADAPQP
jgi:hypothetical protein